MKKYDYKYLFNTKKYGDLAEEMDEKLVRLTKALNTRHTRLKINKISMNEALQFLSGTWSDQVDTFINFMETRASQANTQKWSKHKALIGEKVWHTSRTVSELVNIILDMNAANAELNPKKDKRYYSIVAYKEVY